MTTLAITETLMNNYASLTLIGDVFYDKPYLDNQFSLKADASTTITTDYLTTNYTDTVALTSGYYNKTETDTMLLSYSTGSYVDDKLSLKTDSSQLSSFASLDYLHLKYSDSVDIASNYYNKTENDNLLANKVSTTGDVSLSGNLDVGVGATTTKIKAHFNDSGYTGYMRMEARTKDTGFLHFETNYTYGESFITLSSAQGVKFFMRFSDYAGNPYVQTFQPLTQSSDDRLKENEVIITNACETLSKLRPQIYDKKPDMENDDPTTWHKESGLIAQEMYYDAPELRHLVHKGKPEIDEEGNEIPLPEIPTSIDPKQDPDYSSWGKESASVNYIGLIAYLVKAN